jgi:hypothetical protein
LTAEQSFQWKTDLQRAQHRRGPCGGMKIMHSAGIVEIKQGSGTYVAGDQVEPLVNPFFSPV